MKGQLLAALTLILSVVGCAGPEENLISYHEGEIVSGLVLSNRMKATGCVLPSTAGASYSPCGYFDFENYSLELLRASNLNLFVFNQLVTNAKPIDTGKNLIDSLDQEIINRDPALIQLSSELVELSFRFSDISQKVVAYGGADFRDSKSNYQLLFSSTIPKENLIDLNVHESDFRTLKDINDSWQETYRKLFEGVEDSRFKNAVIDSDVEFMTNVVFMNEVCPNMDDCDCIREIVPLLREWLQDVFLVEEGQCTNVLRTNLTENQRTAEYKKVMASKVAGFCQMDNDKSSKLKPPGGNMLANSRLLFIGKEEMYEYLDDAEALQALNLNEDANKQELENALKELTGKTVIWVGTVERGRRYVKQDAYRDSSAQPVYHIDLFFSPLKWSASSTHESDTLFYLLAVPDINSIDYSFLPKDSANAEQMKRMAKERIGILAARIKETGKEVDRQLKTINIVGKPIEVKFPMRMKCDFNDGPLVTFYWSFCNGIVEEKNGGTVYYIPEYVCYRLENDQVSMIEPLYHKTIQKIEDYATVIPIKGTYEHDAALHCTYLVTQRKN